MWDRSDTDGEGRCLPVRRSERMTWKYEDDKCWYGLVETEKHVLFQCTLYGEERGRWRGAVRDFKDAMEEYEMIIGYHVRSEKIGKTP